MKHITVKNIKLLSISTIVIILLLSSCKDQKNSNATPNDETPFELSHIKNDDIQQDIARGDFNSNKLENPLQSAVYRDDIAAVKLLVKNGYDINFVSSVNENLLHVAARFASIEMSEFLISKGVDININNKYGVSPVSLACRYRSFDLLKLYLENGVDFKKVDANLVKQILKRSGDGSGRSRSGEMMQLLIDKGYDINEYYSANLHQAIAYDSSGYVKLLINNGIKFKEADENGWTILHWAAYYNAHYCATLLKKYPELNRKTTKAFEHTILFDPDNKKFIYKAGLLPAAIAEINKHAETLQVLKQ